MDPVRSAAKARGANINSFLAGAAATDNPEDWGGAHLRNPKAARPPGCPACVDLRPELRLVVRVPAGANCKPVHKSSSTVWVRRLLPSRRPVARARSRPVRRGALAPPLEQELPA